MKFILLLSLLTTATLASAQALDKGELSAGDQAFKQEVLQANYVPQLLQVAEGTEDKSQWQRHLIVWQRLASLQPFNPDFQYQLAKAYARMDDKTGAYNALVLLQNAGLSYPVADVEDFKNIQETKVFDYIVDGMATNAEAYGEGEVIATVDNNFSGMLFENIAYDKANKRFLLASIRSGEIYQIDEKGEFKVFISPADSKKGPWGAIDIVIDADSETFWVASAAMPQYNGVTETNIGKATISHYRLSDGQLLKRYDLDGIESPKLLTALHVAKDGSLFFLNIFNQTIYQLNPETKEAKTIVNVPALTALKAITSNADDSLLYLSDFEQGLFVVNVAEQKVAPMDPKRDRYFSGINDIFYVDGDLIGIQGGVSPARLMRFDLAQDLIIKTSFPVEAGHPAFKTLGNGTLVDDKVYYVADSQWNKMDMGGNLREDATWQPLSIVKSPIAFRMKEHMDNQKRMEEIKRQRGIK